MTEAATGGGGKANGVDMGWAWLEFAGIGSAGVVPGGVNKLNGELPAGLGAAGRGRGWGGIRARIPSGIAGKGDLAAGGDNSGVGGFMAGAFSTKGEAAV